MKKLAIILCVFVIQAFGVGLSVRLETSGPLSFNCIIPDHGGTCSKEEASIYYSMPTQAIIRVTNLSLPEAASREYTDVTSDLRYPVTVQFQEDETLHSSSLIVKEGENLIRLEAVDANGTILAASESNVAVTVDWEY